MRTGPSAIPWSVRNKEPCATAHGRVTFGVLSHPFFNGEVEEEEEEVEWTVESLLPRLGV